DPRSHQEQEEKSRARDKAPRNCHSKGDTPVTNLYCSSLTRLLQEVDALSALISSSSFEKNAKSRPERTSGPVSNTSVEEAKSNFWKEYGTHADLSPYCLLSRIDET